MLFSKTIVVASSILLTAAMADYTVTIDNNCTDTMWPAAHQYNVNNVQPFVTIGPDSHGAVLEPGHTWEVNVPQGALGLRFWARTGCTDDCSSCKTGHCNGGLQCQDPALNQEITLAEFGAGKGEVSHMNFYDLSKIQGFNVGMSIQPSDSSCEVKVCTENNCSAEQAWNSPQEQTDGSPADTGCSATTNYVVTLCPA